MDYCGKENATMFIHLLKKPNSMPSQWQTSETFYVAFEPGKSNVCSVLKKPRISVKFLAEKSN